MIIWSYDHLRVFVFINLDKKIKLKKAKKTITYLPLCNDIKIILINSD